jgi:hypothetical protein
VGDLPDRQSFQKKFCPALREEYLCFSEARIGGMVSAFRTEDTAHALS